MPMRLRNPAFLIAVVSAVPACDRGHSPSLLGKSVVTRARTPLLNDGRVTDDGTAFRVYVVDRAEKGRLYLTSQSASGWVPEADVAPSERAVEFFSECIRHDPSDA